jgi:hypothetical protein
MVILVSRVLLPIVVDAVAGLDERDLLFCRQP